MLSCVKSTRAARWQVLLSRRKEGDESPQASPGRAEHHPFRCLLLKDHYAKSWERSALLFTLWIQNCQGIFLCANEFAHAPTLWAELLPTTCSNSWAPGGEISQTIIAHTYAVDISTAFLSCSDHWTLAHFNQYTNSCACRSPPK